MDASANNITDSQQPDNVSALPPRISSGNLVKSVFAEDLHDISNLFIVIDSYMYTQVTHNIPPPDSVCVFPLCTLIPPTWRGEQIRGYRVGMVQPLALPLAETVLVEPSNTIFSIIQHEQTNPTLLKELLSIAENGSNNSHFAHENTENTQIMGE